jgi:gluconokinase
MRILALDIGTSSVRAIVYDRRLRRVGPGVQVRYAWHAREDGGVDLSAQSLERIVTQAIDGALRGWRDPIDAVGIAAFWHSLVGVDAHGRALTPVLPWSDTRSAREADALRDEVDEHAAHERTGCRLHPSYWPARLRWFRDHDRPTFRRVRRWMSFPAYLERRWLDRDGDSVSQASGTGLYVHRDHRWDGALCRACDVDPIQLGRVLDLDAEGGVLRADLIRRWPALRHARWIPAAGDGALNNVGAGCVGDRRAAVMIGTSGALRMMWETAGTPSVPFELWRYWLDRRRVVVGGALSNGGNLVAWMCERLGLRLGPRLDAAIARLPPDGHGLTLLPYLMGERSPDYRPDARATITGLGATTTAEEILRAGFEAIAYRFLAVLDVLATVRPVTELVAAGTALTSSPAWLQILADVLNVPISLPRDSELTSRGAAIVALEQCGAPAAHLMPAIRRVFRPDARRHAIYRKAAARQQRLQASVLGSGQREDPFKP